jgi:glycosyltransferase involved in cell wall biosynthesis
VATDVGSLRELVEEGETGFLVPPNSPRQLADAITRVLSDGELARRMGEAGRARVVRNFTVEHMVAAYSELFEELLRRRGT